MNLRTCQTGIPISRQISALIIVGLLLGITVGARTTKVKLESRPIKFETKEHLESNLQSQVADLASLFGSADSKSKHNAEDFDITHPTRVNHVGDFISHRVKFDYEEEKSRRKRDVNDAGADGRRRNDNVYFKLHVGKGEVTVNVTQNRKLIHPNFVVERVHDIERAEHDFDEEDDAIMQRSSLQRGTNWPCHYRGHVIGHDQSKVAISTCDGLTGLIRLRGGDYFVEPMTRHHVPSDGQSAQPHKVYRRDVSQQQRRRSKHGAAANTADANAEQSSSNRSNSSKRPDADFCGVRDTKLRYRSQLRARERWESRRHRDFADVTSSQRRRHRVRRQSWSLEQWIEVMVVVDKKMVEYYEAFHHGQVEKYALTIVNMVAELFHDESIGNLLHVTLIRLIVLEGEEKALKISQHAEKTLDSFCRWAKRMNPRSDTHANHHDVAVLLTRRNICSRSNKSCETLGLAHVAGMCQPHRSCNVNQDTGLSVAFTVAHELGHNFAMHHDGQLNSCSPNEKYPRVMAPHLTSNNLPMRWSTCSRRYVTRFLDRNWGRCLVDQPSPEQDTFVYPPELPGVLYNANHQCRLMFGPGSRHCRGIDNICNRLWCVSQGTCRSRLHAAAAGTKCGKGRWCFGGACVLVGKRPLAVNGAWSSWSVWSKCSRTCGVGITSSVRHCDKPTPRNGGRYCLGERKRYRTCNVWGCPDKSSNLRFRHEQCAEFNNVPYRNNTYSWLPVDSAIYPCELHCYTKAGKRTFADRLRDKVVDGTKCYSNADDICVDGVCKRLGCDQRIDSFAREDRCGVCRGDATACSDVTKTFNRTRGEAYVSVGILPMGARNIKVHEVNASENFLALKNPNKDGEYYLNGDYKIRYWDSKLTLAGTTFKYERMNQILDNITAEGPITFDIEVMVLFVEPNPGIEITYVMPHNVTSVFAEEEPNFRWMMQEWGSCSRSCGKGVQMSMAICIEKKAGTVDEDFCDATKRPDDRRRACHHQPCPAEWLEGPWQPCSISCGAKIGRRRRTVVCIRSLSNVEQVVLKGRSCRKLPKPKRVKLCPAASRQPCPMWRAGKWSNCSAPCNATGSRNRTVQCVTYVINDVILSKNTVDTPVDDFLDVGRVGSRKKTKDPTSKKKGGAPGVKEQEGGSPLNQEDNGADHLNEEIQSNHPSKNQSHSSPHKKHKIPPKEDQHLTEEEVYSSVMLNSDVEHLTMNKVHIVKKRGKARKWGKKMLENLHYDVVEDGDCDVERRPHATEVCQGNPCAVPTRKPTQAAILRRDPMFDIPSHSHPPNITSNYVFNPLHSSAASFDIEGSTDAGGKPTDQRLVSNKLLKNPRTQHGGNLFDVRTFLFPGGIKSGRKSPGNSSTSGSGSGDQLSFNVSKTTPTFTVTTLAINASDDDNTFGTSSGALTTDVDTRTTKPITTTTTTSTTSTIGEPSPVTPKPRWLTGYWGQCSTSCGEGARIRNVVCSGGPDRCDNKTKPAPAQRCNLKPCSLWKYGGWTKCSRLCGRGLKFRKIQCRNSLTNVLLRPYHCKTVPRLRAINATCDMKRCMPWKTSRWSRCNATCGPGSQRRRIACSKEGMCDPAARPAVIQQCTMRVCVEWRTTAWERCSVNCGTGLQQRAAECVETASGKLSNKCSNSMKPRTLQKCNLGRCRVTDFDFSACTGDRLKTMFCKVLKKWGKCVQPSLAIQCCATCTTFTSVRRKDKIS